MNKMAREQRGSSNVLEHQEEPDCELDSDSIWCDDFWIYIVIAIGGFFFFIVVGIIGNGNKNFKVYRKLYISTMWKNFHENFLKTAFSLTQKSL